MTKKYLLELAQYNLWANELMHHWLRQINEQQWSQPLVGSFTSIEATALHVAAAEKMWRERLDNKVQEYLPTTFKGDKAALLDIWKTASENLYKYILDFPETALTERFEFRNLKGEELSLERYQAMVHVINHSTYHRGQLVNYLRQVGFTEVSSTDMSTFYRFRTQ